MRWLAVALLPVPALAQGVIPLPPEQITVIATSPLPGTGVDRALLPSQTTVLTSGDIARTGTADMLGALNDQVGGVNLDAAAGNPYQPTLEYHGFTASPLQGSGQGIAVYVNGARFNQPFGDTVNWELLPSIAIDRVTLEGANPVFGLNALGGALNLQMKNGFTTHGTEADLSGGSFGQIDAASQYGVQRGAMALYAAGDELHEAGWRDLQSSDIQNAYGDLGWRNDRLEAHVSLALGNSVLNGPGTSPVELLQADPSAQFTAPNLIANRSLSLNATLNDRVTDTLSIQTGSYYQYLLQRVVNGNAPNDAPCDNGSGLLCSDTNTPSTTRNNAPIPDFLDGGPYSELDTQTTNTSSYGASLQATLTNPIAGHTNHAVIGGSFDGAATIFSATGFIGGLTPVTRSFIGPGIVIDEPGNDIPVRVGVTDATFGVFIADTLSLTDRLALTVSARFNDASIDLHDKNGGDLTGQHRYTHLNPAAGATYRLTPWLTVFAGYAQSNRAPTPAELSCASPQDSCSLANFFVGDPDLKQVIANTVETGLRSAFAPAASLTVSYDVNLFHTDLDNDIVFENSAAQGRAFFRNIGRTRRQGIDAGIEARAPRLHAFIEYSYTQATYQSGFSEDAGSNPAADTNGSITITQGDQLPGVPTTRLKFGADCTITDQWSAGFDGQYQTGQYLAGDDANLTPRLPGFITLNLSVHDQLTPRLQLFARLENIADRHYNTFAAFSPTASVFLTQAPTATNPRSYSPAAPRTITGGIRLTF